jgi:hypothetical protein
MIYNVVVLFALMALCAGCASAEYGPSASPAFTPQGQCEREGGVWHASMNYCEYQAPSTPHR